MTETISAAQLQALIIKEVGDTDTGPVGTDISTLWDLYHEMALIAPRLQYLYTKRHAIDIMMGQLREVTTFENDRVKIYNWEQQKTLQYMREQTQSEIDDRESKASKIRTPQVGQLETVTPISPNDDPATSFMPDASNRKYRGDPYYPISPRRSIG